MIHLHAINAPAHVRLSRCLFLLSRFKPARICSVFPFYSVPFHSIPFRTIMFRSAMPQPPSKYTKEEFHNNVLPRAAENQPPRILNELRQLSCRLVASGIAKGLLLEEDLPQIRKTLVSRFQVRFGRASPPEESPQLNPYRAEANPASSADT